MKTFLLSLLLGLPICIIAQNSIIGRVVDGETEKAVEFATVYINGTTKGTDTDAKGAFKLENVEFPAEVVVSHLSYEKILYNMEGPMDKSIVFKLKPSSVSLAQVEIQDRNKRRRNVQEFRNAFLGLDEFGEKAVLTNDEVLQFSRDYEQREIKGGGIVIGNGQINAVEKKGKDGQNKKVMTIERPLNLKAKSIAPVIIDQPELGYKTRIDLVDFQVTYSRGFSKPATTYWLGYYYFEPYKTTKKSKLKRFAKNRKRAYYNSPLHFLRALYHKELKENGYQIFIRKEDPETRQVNYEEYDLSPHFEYDDKDLLRIKDLKGQQFHIFFFADGKGRPKDLNKKKGKRPIQSMIQFLENPCYVRSNGTIPNYQILFGGAISEKKIGAMLPEDYVLN